MTLWEQARVAWGLVRSYPAPQPVTWETVFGGRGGSPTGITINEDSALNYSPIWAGVSTLSRDIAKLPLMLYRNLPNGGKEPFREHKLYRILKDEPNPEMTSYKFRETMQALCLLYGNAYAEIVRNELGDVAGMYPILPSRVTPIRESNSGRLVYRVSNPNGGQSYLAPANMIHLSSLSTDGVIGHSIVQHGRESFELGMATEKFGAAFFGNGSTFGGVIEVPMALSGATGEVVKDNIRTAVEAVHQGVERAHKILVLAGGSKFTQRGTNPDSAQYIETRKFQINEAARWLGMPPHKLGDLENAHFTNIEEQEIQYYVGCVSGWLKMWEQELSRKCIRRLEYAQQSIEHNMEGVLRGNSSQRADFYAKMFNIGALSINRILQLENQNPIGPKGDVHLVPLNMIPLERYNEMIDAQIAAKKEPRQIEEQKPEPKPTDAEADIRAEIKAAIERAEHNAMRAATAEADAVQARAVAAEAETRSSAAHDAAQQAIQASQVELHATATERDEARSAQTVESEQRAEAERRAAAEQTARTEAEAARQALEVAERTAQEAARASQAERDAAMAERDVAVAERATEAEQRAQAERRAEAAEAARLEAEAATAKHFEDVRSAAEQVALAVARAVAAEQRGDTSEHEKAVADAEILAAKAALLEREDALKASQRTLEAAEQVAKDFSGKVSELESALQLRRDAEMDRLTRVVTAHRALITDAVQRVLKPELDRARRRQLNPDTLKKWADAFYETHRSVCADALYPVVLTHLAWKRSDDDPRVVAEQLAGEHCAESERQIRNLINGTDADEFHPALERMLLRWEQERPDRLADAVLNDEIQYIRSLS